MNGAVCRCGLRVCVFFGLWCVGGLCLLCMCGDVWGVLLVGLLLFLRGLVCVYGGVGAFLIWVWVVVYGLSYVCIFLWCVYGCGDSCGVLIDSGVGSVGCCGVCVVLVVVLVFVVLDILGAGVLWFGENVVYCGSVVGFEIFWVFVVGFP